MECVKKLKIDDTIYTANTDFRVAIECNRISQDSTIGDYERVLAILYTIFGDKGLDNPQHYEKLLNWAMDYLSCGKKVEQTKEKPDMDYIQDMDFIVASFQSDYGINLDETQMDWHKFNTLINGLSNSEMGNCCVLNRVRNLRNIKPEEIKDRKEREKVIKAQRELALDINEPKLSEEQIRSRNELFEKLGL